MEETQRYENSVVYKQSTGNSRKIGGMVPARVVLYVLSFSGFLVSFMMRTDINLAMVAMVKLPPPSNDSKVAISTQCYANSTIGPANSTTARDPEMGEFDWSPAIQSAIIGSFYWCYILSQVVGGVLTQYFGTKTVFGGSQLITAICSLLMPTAAELHYGVMIALRSIQGIASGLTWPAMYAIVGHWIPPVERSRFMSSFQAPRNTLSNPTGPRGILDQRPLNSMRTARVYFQPGFYRPGHLLLRKKTSWFSFGIGITYFLCGFIIAYFGWRVVFYTTGTIGVVWCVFWYLLAFDTPASHPRISQQELGYIQGSVGNQVAASEGSAVPWRSILTSLPAWAIGITTFGRIWVHYVFIIPGPMYMKTVLGFSIQANGLLSGGPFICSYFSSVVFCYIADVLVTRRIMSLINVRKLFTAMSQVIPGILVLLIGYLGCDIILVLIVWFIAVTLITAAYAGAMANIVDIAPNYAGPTLAFAQTIHMTASFLSPIAAGLFTDENQTLDAWRKVFGLTACIACGTYVVYQIFGTADIQSWNYPDQKYPQSAEEDSAPLNESPRKNGKIVTTRSSNSEMA